MNILKNFQHYMTIFDLKYWNNTVKEYLISLAIAVLAMLILRVVKWAVLRYFSNRPQSYKWDMVELSTIAARRTQVPFIMIFAIYAGLQILELPPRLRPWIFSIAMAALILQLTLWANATVDYFLGRSQQRNAARVTTLKAAGFIVKMVLAAIAAVIILDNIPGVEITALIASLGITGIAVALAVQNILSDLFASLSIVLDKPFVIGDFIIVDTHMGTVENIGLKTTRLRSLSGEQLVFSNNDLLKSRVRNFKRMAERRVVFSLGVTY
ncbi:MAG: mechanosensitive ion channel domain-containing protein, partial [Desulfobacterales bacterium]